MRLSSFIARRYLRSPKSHSVINLISWVAGMAIAIPSAALVIILSLHNGLSDMIEGLYNSFDSEIRITAAEGKYFDPEQIKLDEIQGIAHMSHVIEDNILIRKGEREHLATIRGVDSAYSQVVPIERLITHGKYEPQLGDLQQAIVGQGVAYYLGINISLIETIDIYSIRPDRGRSIVPVRIYRNESITPIGIFTLDEQTDGRYVITPLSFAQNLLGFPNKISSIEISLKKGKNPDLVKQQIIAQYGDTFKVETRFEQKASLYRAINQEKWIIYLLLMMVLLIASLSLAGSIIILIADKRSQIDTLRSMGATTRTLRAIFTREGMLIVSLGAMFGILIGSAFSLLQQHYGFLRMAGSTMLADAYPVRVSPLDLLIIALGVWTLGWIISAIAAHATIKDQQYLSK